jgi:hypothetical protein
MAKVGIKRIGPRLVLKELDQGNKPVVTFVDHQGSLANVTNLIASNIYIYIYIYWSTWTWGIMS